MLTATVALIYIIFQIYFDWSWLTEMSKTSQKANKAEDVETAKKTPGAEEPENMNKHKPSRTSTYIWSLAHFPFHLALVLIMEGATQFVVWWKIVELIDYVGNEFLHAFRAAEASTESGIASRMVEHLNGTVNSIWEHYPPDLLVTFFHKEELLKQIGQIDDTYWRADFQDPESMAADPRYQNFTEKYRALKVTILNSILKNFNIEAIEDSGWQDHPETYEEHAFQDASCKFNLVVRVVPSVLPPPVSA